MGGWIGVLALFAVSGYRISLKIECRGFREIRSIGIEAKGGWNVSSIRYTVSGIQYAVCSIPYPVYCLTSCHKLFL